VLVPGTEPRFWGLSTHIIVTVLTELFRVINNLNIFKYNTNTRKCNVNTYSTKCTQVTVVRTVCSKIFAQEHPNYEQETSVMSGFRRDVK
jgi:hypothetical protein